jgi:hypothetical protein
MFSADEGIELHKAEGIRLSCVDACKDSDCEYGRRRLGNDSITALFP